MNSDPKTYGCITAFAPLGEEQVFALAERKMKQERRYLDSSLTMESLATEMGVHRNSLSHAVNKFAGVSFPVWLGEYRVTEVERLASLPENRVYRIMDLAYEAGFSDHASFYRVFKKLRHLKPSAALKGLACPDMELTKQER